MGAALPEASTDEILVPVRSDARTPSDLLPGLARTGRSVQTFPEGAALPGDGLVLVPGNPLWFPATMRQLIARGAGAGAVIWHFEPLPMPASAGLPRQRLHARELAKILLRDSRRTDPSSNARELLRIHRTGVPYKLVVSSRASQDFLGEQGIASEFVPFGASAAHGRLLGLERDIDALFIGAPDVPRRNKLLRGLRRAGIAVEQAGSWGKGGLWGEERTTLLNRTKVLVNVSRYPGQFSGPRLVLGAVNGCLTVSEPMYRPDPFVPGEHFVSAETDGLAEAITRALEDEAERARIVASSREVIATHPYEGSIERVLELGLSL